MQNSVCISNEGNRKLVIKALPSFAQMSMINGIITDDVNNDGKKDIVVAGNFYPFRVQLGPMDAGIGSFLKGDGRSNFTPIPYDKTSLYIPGDVRNMIEVKSSTKSFLIVAKNNGPIQVLKCIKRQQ